MKKTIVYSSLPYSEFVILHSVSESMDRTVCGKDCTGWSVEERNLNRLVKKDPYYKCKICFAKEKVRRKLSKNSQWKIFKRVRCDCGHYPIDHYKGEGWCDKCGCTWYYPNFRYIKKLQQLKKDLEKEKKEIGV